MFICYRLDHLSRKIYKNLEALVFWYQDIKLLYTILFEPSEKKIETRYEIIKPYLSYFKPRISLDFGIYDKYKRRVKLKSAYTIIIFIFVVYVSSVP